MKTHVFLANGSCEQGAKFVFANIWLPLERERRHNQQINYYHFCCSDISTGEELAELDNFSWSGQRKVATPSPLHGSVNL